jgi:hypothetical protein
MFGGGAGISRSHYDNTLNRWAQLGLQDSVDFNAGSSVYCATSARGVLVSTFSWDITDGGLDTDCPTTGGGGSGGVVLAQSISTPNNAGALPLIISSPVFSFSFKYSASQVLVSKNTIFIRFTQKLYHKSTYSTK